jgi:hypothetical protein
VALASPDTHLTLTSSNYFSYNSKIHYVSLAGTEVKFGQLTPLFAAAASASEVSVLSGQHYCM